MEPLQIVLIVEAVIIGLLVLAGMWMMFAKAGKPGWYSIIPILNTITLINIAGRPWWWIFLLFIPIVNTIVMIILLHSISKAFGYGVLMTIALFVLGIIFLPFLGLGGSIYTRPNTGVPA